MKSLLGSPAPVIVFSASLAAVHRHRVHPDLLLVHESEHHSGRARCVERARRLSLLHMATFAAFLAPILWLIGMMLINAQVLAIGIAHREHVSLWNDVYRAATFCRALSCRRYFPLYRWHLDSNSTGDHGLVYLCACGPRNTVTALMTIFAICAVSIASFWPSK